LHSPSGYRTLLSLLASYSGPGVVFGEAYPGKIPELVTPRTSPQGNLLGWTATALPACILFNSDSLDLRARAANSSGMVVGVDFSEARLYRPEDEPSSTDAGVYRLFTSGVYTSPQNISYPLILGGATFNPLTAPALNARLVDARPTDACLVQRFDDCRTCFALPSPFASTANLSNAIALLDISSVSASYSCYDYVFQFALAAQQAGAAALLVRAAANTFPWPRAKYLVPGIITIPTYTADYDQTALIKRNLGNSSARLALPALVNGVGPAYYPDVLAELGFSTTSVYTLNSALTPAATCELGQSSFSPVAWPGMLAPTSAGPEGFGSTARFLRAEPLPVCASDATCADCLAAAPNQMRIAAGQTPPPVGARFALFAVAAGFACSPTFIPLTQAAIALNASALILVIGNVVDTLVDNASHQSTIPTWAISTGCYNSWLNIGLTATLYGTLPSISGGLAVNTSLVGVGSSAAIGGINDAALVTSNSTRLPPTTLLAETSAGAGANAICPAGRCSVGQATYNPRSYGAITASVVVLQPSANCANRAFCNLCASRYAWQRYVNSTSGTLLSTSTPLRGAVVLMSFSMLTCSSMYATAADLATLGAVGVIYSSSSVPATLSLTSGTPRLTLPVWHISHVSGAAMTVLATTRAVRVRSPGLADGVAQVPGSWLDARRRVDLSTSDGVTADPDAAGQAAEEERKRVITGAVLGLLLGGGGLFALVTAGVLYYRRRRRAQGGAGRYTPYAGDLDPGADRRWVAPNWAAGGAGGTVLGTPVSPTRGMQLAEHAESPLSRDARWDVR